MKNPQKYSESSLSRQSTVKHSCKNACAFCFVFVCCCFFHFIVFFLRTTAMILIHTIFLMRGLKYTMCFLFCIFGARCDWAIACVSRLVIFAWSTKFGCTLMLLMLAARSFVQSIVYG